MTESKDRKRLNYAGKGQMIARRQMLAAIFPPTESEQTNYTYKSIFLPNRTEIAKDMEWLKRINENRERKRRGLAQIAYPGLPVQ